MSSRTSSNDLTGLVAVTAVFTLCLHQLGGTSSLAVDWSDPVGWFEASQAEDAIAATLRSIGLVIGYWVLGTTALYVAFGLRRREHRPRWVTLLTHRWIRRIADRALAVTLTASIVATPIGPAAAETPSPPIVFEAETDGIPVPHVRMPVTVDPPAQAPQETTIADEPSPLVTPIRNPTPVATVAVEQSQTYTVASGDNLWTIASAHIESTVDGDPSAPEVTEYWLRVIAANRDTLRSGDPNLIYPGEIVALPLAQDAP